jgi:amidohydrolase
MSHLLSSLESHHATYKALRQRLHTIPETAYEERQTSDIIAQELESYGLEVHRGLAETGVVGVLRNGSSQRSIGFRADIDALNIIEQNELPYRSTVTGKMHACGHDGHTTMLLMAARHLSETRSFDGTVVFIFQPAEEIGTGARRMIDEGLFERFPVDQVYGMHNIPGMPAGQIAVMPGPVMAAGDVFEITLTARGGHGAMPHTTPDPILAGCAFVQGVQSLVSRSLNPLETGVISVTQFNGGVASNIIPNTVRLRGTVRSHTAETQAMLEAGLRRFAAGTAESYGVQIEVDYQYGFPVTINTPNEAKFAYDVLSDLFGTEYVRNDLKPIMGSEDFACMLQVRPGAYLWIGNGDSGGLHSSRYDFNDDILTRGAACWVALAEAAL